MNFSIDNCRIFLDEMPSVKIKKIVPNINVSERVIYIENDLELKSADGAIFFIKNSEYLFELYGENIIFAYAQNFIVIGKISKNNELLILNSIMKKFNEQNIKSVLFISNYMQMGKLSGLFKIIIILHQT